MNLKYLKFSLVFFGFVPLAFVLSLLAFYFHAGIVLGHLPQYDFPDPKELSIYSNYALLINFFGVWSYSFVIWLFVVIISATKKIHGKFIIFGLLAYLSAILITFSEVTNWYMD